MTGVYRDAHLINLFGREMAILPASSVSGGVALVLITNPSGLLQQESHRGAKANIRLRNRTQELSSNWAFEIGIGPTRQS
jgi:hypothetical protein